MRSLLILLPFTFLLSACSFFANGEPNGASSSSASSVISATNTAESVATETLSALKEKDMERLSSLAHPQKGIRFTPYTHVNTATDLVFLPDELQGVMDDERAREFVWGEHDGSGEPIEMMFEEYFDRYVWSRDFTKAKDITWDTVHNKGNALDNAMDVYPNARIVEYHVPGTHPDYGGMDWQSLRLILEQENGEWFLVGVIHDEWTI